jgi:cytochrome P450
MFPPTVVLANKVVPPEGDTLAGHFVPGGTKIGVNAATVMQHKETFGEDTNVFRPERFVEADPETRLEMERTTELVFGFGRWMCAGKNVAFLELNKVLVEVSWSSQCANNLLLPKAVWSGGAQCRGTVLTSLR